MSIVYEKECRGSVDVVASRLEKAVVAHQFGVIGTINLQEKMAAKGVQLGRQCRIYEVCNPNQAKKVLDANMSIATALPCRIAVYEDAGKVKISTILPSMMLGMFGALELASVADEVERDITAMIDEAAGT